MQNAPIDPPLGPPLARSLDELRRFRNVRDGITLSHRRLADRERDFARSLGYAGERIHERQHVFASRPRLFATPVARRVP